MSEQNQPGQPAPAQQAEQPATKTTAQIQRELRAMTEEEQQKYFESQNKVDSQGNRCTYCGTSFPDQTKLNEHVSKEHATEGYAKPVDEHAETAQPGVQPQGQPPAPT